MTEETAWPGVFCKNADPLVLNDLEKQGQLFSAPYFEHSYPHCWRCDTPLIYYARESWFIKMSAVKENLIKNNNTINWVPDNLKIGFLIHQYYLLLADDRIYIPKYSEAFPNNGFC